MKAKLSHVALAMMHLGKEGETFRMEEVQELAPCSRSTFQRAVSNFRSYLKEFQPDYELVCGRSGNFYQIKKKEKSDSSPSA